MIAKALCGRPESWVLIAALSLGEGGCATSNSAVLNGQGRPVEKRQPERVELSTTIVSEEEALSIEELLARADKKLDAEDYEGAAKDYELALDHASHTETRLRALLGLGTSLDLGAKPEAAVRAYSRYAAEAPPGARRDEIRVREVRLLVYLERYAEANRESYAIALSGRTSLQQLALLSARAHFQLQEGKLDEAARTISKGRALVDAHGFDRVAVPPLDVAALSVALGDLRARRAVAIRFDPLPSDFAGALEERCQLILDAQSAFSDAMRSQDAHWSSMSGVKVGQLYKDLHAELMAIPAPPTATTSEKKQLFEGAMRLRYAILMTKSLSMMKATVSLLEQAPQKSRWRDKAREALLEIKQQQKAEEAAIDALPYSRAQLQQVLDEMAERARLNASSPSGS